MDKGKNANTSSFDDNLKSLIKNVANPTPLASALITPAGTISNDALALLEQRFRRYTEISHQIAQKNELAVILERVMDAAIEITGAERGFLLLKSESAKLSPLPGFEIKTARRFNQNTLEKNDLQISMTAVKHAMDEGTTLLTENAQLDPRLQKKKSIVQYQLKAILVIPLYLENEAMGAIYLDHRFQQGLFNENDVGLLNAFATQASLSIQKAQLIDNLQKAKMQLEEKVETQAQRIAMLDDELALFREQLRYGYEEIIGQSPSMMEVFHLLDHVTETMIPVWIHGESGTGKELIARSLHFNSPRKAGHFVSENCSAIPENLLESELFGHKKGAFTHADRDRVGLFEQANGGTLFLDEVADMPMGMQVKLLRALQEGEIRPLGANKIVKVDVRLVTASNKDIAKLVKEDKFREDLYFRINGITVKLPPLRERKEDIPLLVNHLIQKISQENKLQPCEMTDEAYEILLSYPWPGNIRQLESVLRNALLFAKGRPITPVFLSLGRAAEEDLTGAKEIKPINEKSEERLLIMQALKRAKTDKHVAANILGISLRSLYLRLDRYGIPKNKALLMKFLGIK